MEQVFSYIISLGASVMMPIIFTVIGLCIGMKFGKALKSGLFVGVGFVGLGVVTALLTTNFNDPLKAISDIYHLQLNVFDMGWPAAAAVAYNTAVGALIIPICLGVNFLMLITKTTRTVNIDLWNYWHFAFIGAVAYFVMGQSLLWGYFAAIVCYINTLVCADLTADRFQKYYDLDGISIPQPFCQSFMPFAIVFNKLFDMIPGFSKLDIDAEGLEEEVWCARRATGTRCYRRCPDWLGSPARYQEDSLPGCNDGSRDGADSSYHIPVYRRFEAYL